MSIGSFGRKSLTSAEADAGGHVQPRVCSIGLVGVPFDRGASLRGASLGPAALRISGLADTLRGLGHVVVDTGDAVPAPGALSDPAGMRPFGLVDMTAWATAIHDHTLDSLRKRLLPVVLGGDHSIAMGSVAAAQRYAQEMDKDLTVLWLDAHADFNTPDTTPSGNMHGMPVAFLCGDASLEPILAGRGFQALHPGRIHLFGLRSVDRDERRALRARGLKAYDMRMIDEFGVSALIRDLLRSFDAERTHLHVSFDLDLIDPLIAPGVGTPVQGGLSYREAHMIMELLFDSGLVGSVDVVEFNPLLDERGTTARLAIEMVSSLFGRTIL